MTTFDNTLARSIVFTETATPLGAAATYTGATRDSKAASGNVGEWGKFNAFFSADQGGTASIQVSTDNVTWATAASAALAANTPLTLTIPVMFRYHRAVLLNGATIETKLLVGSSFTA